MYSTSQNQITLQQAIVCIWMSAHVYFFLFSFLHENTVISGTFNAELYIIL